MLLFNYSKNYCFFIKKWINIFNNCVKSKYFFFRRFFNKIYSKKSLKEDIEKSFKFKDNKDKDLDDKEKNKIYNQIFIKNVKEEKSDSENKSFDLTQIFNNPLFKISKNGEEMIKANLEKFREKNYNITLSLIDSVLKGIEFFDKLCLSFDINNIWIR